MRNNIPVGDNRAECNHREGWRKSSYSMSDGQCVEITNLGGGHIGVRDSVMAEGLILRFGLEGWTAFLAELRLKS